MSDQQSTSDRPPRLWKRVFTGIYIAFTVSVCIVTLCSVLAALAGGRAIPIKGRQISARADNPRELRNCHKRLERLRTSLHREVFTLQAKALRFDVDPAIEWRNWSHSWRGRWRRLNHRCRLEELGGRGVSQEIDKMAAVHVALDELRLSYSEVMNSFVERYMKRMRKLRMELAEVRSMIDQRGKPAGPEQGHGASK